MRGWGWCAVASTSFFLPISRVAARGGADPREATPQPLQPPSKGMPARYGPRRKPYFPFRPLSSDSCCRHMFGYTYGPHKVILIDRKRYLLCFTACTLNLLGFIAPAFVPPQRGTWPSNTPPQNGPGENLQEPGCAHQCDTGTAVAGQIQGPAILSLAEASSQHLAKIVKGSCKVFFRGMCTYYMASFIFLPSLVFTSIPPPPSPVLTIF